MKVEYKNYILESNPMESYKHLFELKKKTKVKDKESGKMRDSVKGLAHGITLHSALNRIVKMQVADDNKGETILLKEYMKLIRQEYDYLKRVLEI